MRGHEAVALPGGAATAGITYPLPTGECTSIDALAFALVTGAGVANRQVVALLEDGGGTVVFGVAAPGVQTAAQTVTYSFAPLVPAFGSAALAHMGGPFFGGKMPPNVVVSVQVVNAQAGDVLTDGRLLVQQWPVIE